MHQTICKACFEVWNITSHSYIPKVLSGCNYDGRKFSPTLLLLYLLTRSLGVRQRVILKKKRWFQFIDDKLTIRVGLSDQFASCLLEHIAQRIQVVSWTVDFVRLLFLDAYRLNSFLLFRWDIQWNLENIIVSETLVLFVKFVNVLLFLSCVCDKITYVIHGDLR